MPLTPALSAQRLAEFLAALSAVPDGRPLERVAAERAARALAAEVAAVMAADGTVTASVGFPLGRVPGAILAEVAAGTRDEVPVPGAGVCRAVSVPIGGGAPGHLLVARSAGGFTMPGWAILDNDGGPNESIVDDGFTVDEVSLIRGMARVLELTLHARLTLAAERRQAEENSRLLRTLQVRQRLLEQISEVQRAITRRAPLPRILDTITAAARDLLDDDVAGLRIRDPDDPGVLLLMASTGLPDQLVQRVWELPLETGGPVVEAYLRGDLVVSSDPARLTSLNNDHVRAVMAAPVHENSTVVGCLVVGSYQEDRRYTAGDRNLLAMFAEQVSLALTDARTREAIVAAYHDSLTGLASRALFLDRLAHRLAEVRDGRQGAARPTHPPVPRPREPEEGRPAGHPAVLFVDLDRFKTVNDSLGHSAGDLLLVGVAERLRGCLGAQDTAARVGGDEFTIMLSDVTGPEQAKGVADRILDSLRAAFPIHGGEVFIDASIGVAVGTDPGQDAEGLVRDADVAMYHAKQRRTRCELFQPAMHTTFVRRLGVEANLRRALEHGEFVLRYQPIVALDGGEVVGLEALLRWQHPQRGLLEPAEFVPIAEDAGLIVPIDRWVLGEACRRAASWNARRPVERPLTITANLSARGLQQPDLPGVVAGALRDSGLGPECLVLEITESLLLNDTDTTMHRLGALKAQRVRIAIDDFGTGYSSLAYLRRFPMDIVKVAKSFVDDIAVDPVASAVARAIVQLGQLLNLTTIAEGIEGAEQLDLLRESGCELGQGYYFAKPLDPDEVETLLFRPVPLA
jgi:diguanylate cyclase (GGDEF)-like protein